MTKIAVLGSTGSIGTQTLDIVSKNKDLQVVGLAAGRNIDLLERQIRTFRPKLAAVGDPALAKELEVRVKDTGCKVAGGMEGLIRVAVMEEAEILVTAIVGMIGIRPTIEAICAGKDIALANKETLVTAGHIIMPLAEEKGVKIYPVDSEHSAIYQCLHGEKSGSIQKLLITASGGPFRGKKREDLEHVRVEDALKHPNWAMGHKITIDSATLVNKGLEVMEAKWLFGVDLDQIQVVVQPQSVIHSMVEFVDGSVMAQLGSPDMRLPIQYWTAVLWLSLAVRICVFLFNMPCIGEKEDFWMMRDWILQNWDLLLSRRRIQRLLKDFLWLWKLPGQEALCPQYLTQLMKKQWPCF